MTSYWCSYVRTVVVYSFVYNMIKESCYQSFLYCNASPVRQERLTQTHKVLWGRGQEKLIPVHTYVVFGDSFFVSVIRHAGNVLYGWQHVDSDDPHREVLNTRHVWDTTHTYIRGCKSCCILI